MPGGYDSESVAAIAQEVWRRPVHCIFLPGLACFVDGNHKFMVGPFAALLANANSWKSERDSTSRLGMRYNSFNPGASGLATLRPIARRLASGNIVLTTPPI